MNKFVSGASYGDKFEQLFELWCDALKIPFRKEKTLSNSKRRHKDKSCDYELILKDKSIFIELKTAQIKQSLDYSVYEDGRNHKIKFHQICKMDYLIIEWRSDKNVYVVISKKDFLKFAGANKKNSINYKDSLSIGTVINDLTMFVKIHQNT